MTDSEILNKILSISKELVPDYLIENEEQRLLLIGSDSVRMVSFISSIEDEFNICIDDDLINFKFFSNLDYIINCIQLNINKSE